MYVRTYICTYVHSCSKSKVPVLTSNLFQGSLSKLQIVFSFSLYFLTACKASQENNSPRKTSSRENCNFRRKQLQPDKAAQLMRELTNLVGHSSTCSGRKENDHHDNGDFELNGVADCPEVLAELLDTRYIRSIMHV